MYRPPVQGVLMATFEYQRVFSHFGDGKNLYIFQWDFWLAMMFGIPLKSWWDDH